VPKIIAHVRELESQPGLPYYLVGHSAGGQFLVRLAAFLPGEAVRIVAGNPGSHLFPTREQDFGYGFGGLPPDLSNDEVIRRYLAAPLTFYLGTDDIYPRPSFDDSPPAMKQGSDRLERGRACFAAAQQLARERGWTFNWRKVETPGIGHDAACMFAAKEAGDALFGKN
jgi:pimeloyl-ACP methyl ester carboxylesterase